MTRYEKLINTIFCSNKDSKILPKEYKVINSSIQTDKNGNKNKFNVFLAFKTAQFYCTIDNRFRRNSNKIKKLLLALSCKYDNANREGRTI